ncbi:f2ac1eeb-b7f6-445d-8e4b-e27435fa4e97 [Thermothielavioides terrestris]|uniref:F2ac1eeb-b7f6-445d-8e4b-e27435fa4e97 n=1 Tax=Thermothielavioides terrestris TaxID=2587410 RepID=A0A3S4AMS2_9PEZI|nr:f2ac1eeb-b7f6-445d-8e4b-e27435fa4e97 [Thermothielavioides terrestris]
MEPALEPISGPGIWRPAAILALTVAIVLVALRTLRARGRGNFPLPPGPPPEPLLGHCRTVPQDAAFKRYAEWAREYKSDVLYFHTFGTKWIVLHSLAAATELLEKRGANYADRPRFVMFEEMGWSPTLTWLRWGPKYHLHRRVLRPPFTRSNVGQYAAMQRKEALVCCQGMIDNPDHWLTAVRRFAVAIVLKIAYGLEVDGPSSRWIRLAENAANAVGKSGAPASSIMDRFPATRYFPDWLPFMERLRYARTWRSAIENITSLPFEAALSRMASDGDNQSFVRTRIGILHEDTQKGLPSEFGIEDIKGAAATIVIAGNDTTAATLMLLVLYLMQNPDVQRKAQQEIDRVVGTDRLPAMDDIPNLPYTNLVLQETYRTNPLSPLGIPHASLTDDVYNGMFIPKGTIVYPNVWAMLHDESIYAEPFRFWPERYLPKDQGGNEEPLPVGNFGFGRRYEQLEFQQWDVTRFTVKALTDGLFSICIGRDLAENSLLIVLATTLATADINWPLGADGQPAPFEPEWSFRGQAIVLPFKTSITSRSTKSKALLDAEVAALGARQE